MKARNAVIGALLVGLLSICPAAQDDRQKQIARIEGQIRDLEQQRQYLERENYETARTITSLEQQIKDKQSKLDNAVTLNQQLSKCDRRINDAKIRRGQAWKDLARQLQDDTETAYIISAGINYPLLHLHHRVRKRWSQMWNVRVTTVSAIDDEIDAVNEELTGPVRVWPDREPVTLSGLEDFRRVVRTELLRAQMVQADIQELRRRVQDMQHRLKPIDVQREDARRSIDRLKRNVELLSGESGESPPDTSTTEEQVSAEDVQRDRDRSTTESRTEPPPTESAPKQPRVTGRVADVTASRVLGTPPQRRCVWRFYIELEEANDAPVELVFKQAIRKPKAQDPDASSWHGSPPMRHALRLGEKVILNHRYVIVTGMEILTYLRVDPKKKIANKYTMKAERKRKFGPFYLTVWETDDFAGEFRAVFESVWPTAFAGEITKVTFKPKPPPWDRIRGTMRVVHPTDSEMASGSLGGQSYQPYIKVEVDVPDLAPGMYRMRAEVDKAGTRYLWGRLKKGSKKLEFEGGVPMLPGRQKVTLSMPDLPQVTFAKLNLNVVPPSNAASRASIRSLQTQIQQLQSKQAANSSEQARKYHQRRLANSFSQLAFKHIERGEFSTAKSYIDQAMGHLQAAGAADELTTGGYGSDVTRGTLLGHMATVAYFTSSTGEVRKNLTALAEYYEASAANCIAKGDNRTASQLRGEAAKCYWKMADQLLMLGVCDPAEAAAVWRRGESYSKKAGARGDRRKPSWWPE